MDLFLQTLLNGMLQSGIYALVASGLALAVGVVGIVNFAHGEFLMIGAFMAWAASAFLGIDPLLSLPIVAVAVFGVGALTYRVSIRHVLLAPELNQMLLTFGLGILLQNLALMLLGGNTRTVTTPYQASSLNIGELSIGGPKAIAFGLAVVLLGALYFMLYRTVLGRQMRAVAQNRRGAQLIGIPVDRVYLIAFGVSCGLAAVAGVLVSVLLFASPTVGLVFALKAFAIIVMAGLGNLTGVLWASVILGLSEALVQTYVPGGGGWSDAVFFLMIFGTLVIRSFRKAA
ncbi:MULTISPECIES: branched-chain amino acid ABC transporter permease [Deinococcus]|uniref:Branched-chain amino acid ABC transporter permease n=2 Tax=Deinococcus TaxID=1298 RepID=A0A553UIQ9_9DEIO|nr:MULTISPECIES: branched-chain amino acid ABC transporter permease [Deinococcus]AZI44979.1 branched-chain amino acid ABC transporter permease [Deinococcus psychrotolerans]QFP75241.1 branched-chain amino acid ABC transporter permease [Deinococcus sp. AJ005]TSA80097.1 branched-chain amino acid ABC transporter permease [Deinococcus detaillensis]